MGMIRKRKETWYGAHIVKDRLNQRIIEVKRERRRTGMLDNIKKGRTHRQMKDRLLRASLSKGCTG